MDFIEGRLGKSYATAKNIEQAEAVELLKEKIQGSSPKLRGATVGPCE